MSKRLRFEDLEMGQHVWVLYGDELVLVAKFNEKRFDVCGPWESGINKNECKIVGLVNRPIKQQNKSLYYMEKQ